jgi:hypothetical protein
VANCRGFRGRDEVGELPTLGHRGESRCVDDRQESIGDELSTVPAAWARRPALQDVAIIFHTT